MNIDIGKHGSKFGSAVAHPVIASVLSDCERSAVFAQPQIGEVARAEESTGWQGRAARARLPVHLEQGEEGCDGPKVPLLAATGRQVELEREIHDRAGRLIVRAYQFQGDALPVGLAVIGHTLRREVGGKCQGAVAMKDEAGSSVSQTRGRQVDNPFTPPGTGEVVRDVSDAAK